jgi:peptide/nickel transport system permease protein
MTLRCSLVGVKRYAPPRVIVGNAVTLALAIGVAAMLLYFAARNFLPASSSAGLAGSALQGWSISEGVQPFGRVVPGFDLAGQAGTPGALLVLLAALNSAFLVLLATGVAMAVGVPLGFWLAIHAPRRVVGALRAGTNIGVAFPAFFVAFLLQVAAVEATGRLGHSVVPVYGFGLDGHLVIPVFALTLAPLAFVVRLVALSATELNIRDFVRTARAKGLSERVVVYRHIAPNMLGAIGEAGLGALRAVLAGLVIVEYLLVWPGLGVLALRAANVQDPPIFLASAAVLAAVFYCTDLGLDLVTNRRGLIAG